MVAWAWAKAGDELAFEVVSCAWDQAQGELVLEKMTHN